MAFLAAFTADRPMRFLAHLRAAPRAVYSRISSGVSWLAGFGPAFWQFIFGLAFIFFGVRQYKPGLAWFLVGLLLVWDATRTPSKK